MTHVTADEIRNRLTRYADAQRELEHEYDRVGAWRRQDSWRHAYYSHPYLIGAPVDRIAKRFQEVMFNQSELTPGGQIGLLPVTEDSFMQKFTHLLEEYGARQGGPTSDVIQAARGPILKYFQHGEPIAMRIFRDYTPPPTPFIVKYGEKKYLEPLFRFGDTRICQASYYNNASFLASVQDNEVSRTFFIPTFRERLRGQDSIEVQGNRITFGHDDIVLPVVVPDYYLFSLCSSVYYRMPTDFNADAALIIKDPVRFSQRFISAFLAKMPDWEPFFGPVTYYDPYLDFNKFRDVEMAKHFGYSYQREVRIAFRSKRPIRTALQPVSLCIGSMEDYAELLCA